MLIPLGFLAASGVSAGSFDLLETQTLTGSQASVTFSSLSTYASTYQHLQLRIVAKTGTTGWGFIQVNSDSGSNYSRHELRGSGSSVTSSASSNYDSFLYGVVGSGWGSSVIDLLDPFETSKFKTFRALSGWVGADGIQLTSGNWRNTNAISSILIDLQGVGNYDQYSRFSLYGWKAA
jgi:hypothetical protein